MPKTTNILHTILTVLFNQSKSMPNPSWINSKPINPTKDIIVPVFLNLFI
jgi:hypothetical protein